MAPIGGLPTCDSGKCGFGCSAGRSKCSGACADTSDDVNNCGGCGKTCPSMDGASTACVNGQCQFNCNAGLSLCNGVCVNTLSDSDNCGACGRACKGKKQCLLGLCVGIGGGKGD